MRLQRSCLSAALSILLTGFLILPGLSASKEWLARPVILKIYPNPAGPGDLLYVEAKNLIETSQGLRAPNPPSESRLPEGTYVEFTTKYGVKRVPALLMRNPPIPGVQICSVTVPPSAVSGKVKIVTIARKSGQTVGSMSVAADLNIVDESPARGSHHPLSLLKALPQKIISDAFYYQTERVGREAKHAFIRQENLRFNNAQYDINRAGYFNALPSLRDGRGRVPGADAEAWLRPGGSSSFASQFFSPSKSADQTPFYTRGNRETMQKDVQEDVYNYLKPLFERWTHLKLDAGPPVEKTGFTRPHFRFAYSLGMAVNNSMANQGGLARDVGVRIDFDYVRVNPLSDQAQRTLSFTLGADSRRTEINSNREQRFLFLIRFR